MILYTYIYFGHSHAHLAPCGCRAASPSGVAAVDVSQPGHGGGVARGGNVAGGAAQRKVWRSPRGKRNDIGGLATM